MESNQDIKQTVWNIQHECLEGRIDVVRAIDLIDDVIGDITRGEYKDGLKFKIHNHGRMFALVCRGLRARTMPLVHAMAVYAQTKAIEHGNRLSGEIHISRDASTKHHRGGISRIAESYAG